MCIVLTARNVATLPQVLEAEAASANNAFHRHEDKKLNYPERMLHHVVTPSLLLS